MLAPTKSRDAIFDALRARATYATSGPRILLDARQVTVLDEAALLEECRQAAQDLMRRADVEV